MTATDEIKTFLVNEELTDEVFHTLADAADNVIGMMIDQDAKVGPIMLAIMVARVSDRFTTDPRFEEVADRLKDFLQ